MISPKESLFPTRVRTVTQTTAADPCQWEGETEDNEHIYARFKHGILRVSVSRDYWAAIRGAKGDFMTVLGAEFNLNALKYEELKRLTAGRFMWPPEAADVARTGEHGR